MENERWSFPKKYTEIWYFLQIFWKDGLSKKIVLEYGLSCIFRKDNIFFPKIWSYSLDGKWKTIFLKKIHEKYDIFCVLSKYVFPLQIWYCPSVKTANMIFTQKIHLKMTFPLSLKKMIFVLESRAFLLTGKLKMIKRFTQSNTHRFREN